MSRTGHRAPGRWLCLAAGALLLAAPWTVRTAEGQAPARLPPATAAVVDVQRIFKDASAARAISDQVEARRRLYQEEIAKEEQRLHDSDKDIARQRTTLTPEAYADMRRNFESQVAEVQRKVQERRRQLDQAKAIALNEVREAMIDVARTLAEERGFNLLLPSSGLVLFSPRSISPTTSWPGSTRSCPTSRCPRRSISALSRRGMRAG